MLRLDVIAIKIDHAFTQTVGTNAVTASVVPQILAMPRLLNLHVVVEGVETREQADYFPMAEGPRPGLTGRPARLGGGLRRFIRPHNL